VLFTDVIFDLDGTLIDSAREIIGAVEVAVAATNLQAWEPITRSHVGPPIDQIIARVCPDASPDDIGAAVQRFRDIYDGSNMHLTEPYRGAQECLEQLRENGVRVWIATNKPLKPTRRILDRWFPERVDGYCCIDSLAGRRLSKAEMFERLRTENLFRGEGVLAVGDGPSEIEAAKCRGWFSVAALYGYTPIQQLMNAAPDATIHDIGGLLQLVDRTRSA